MRDPSRQIDFSLRQVAEVLRRETDKIKDPLSREVAATVTINPGRMIRPAIGLAAYSFLGGSSFPEAPNFVMTAAGIEMAHAASLLADDVFDESATRRGKPAAHIVYGRDAALLVPYLMIQKSQAMIMRGARSHGLDETRLVYVEELVSEVTGDLIAGELSDLRGSERNHAEAMGCLYMKNGLPRLSCSLPMLFLGRDHLSTHFYNLGISFSRTFQYADDLIDLLGSEEETGKPVRQDGDSPARRVPLDQAINTYQEMRKETLGYLADICQGGDSDFERIVRGALDLSHLTKIKSKENLHG